MSYSTPSRIAFSLTIMRLRPSSAKAGFQDQQAAGDDRPAVAGQAGQVDGVDALELEQRVADRRQRRRR